jgi:RNA polymerase sigma-70 factor (ECF subfamily)
MDEQTLFRTTHNDVVPLGDAALSSGHERFLRQIEKRGYRATSTPRRRTALRIGFGTVAAGALATALVVTGILGPAGMVGGADSAAAAVLQDAANATIRTADPAVGPGQYLVVRTTAVTTINGGLADGTVGDYQSRQSDTLYIPSSQKVQWMWIRNFPSIEKTFGPASAAVAKYWIDGMKAEGTAPEVVRGVDGNFYGTPDQYTPAFLASLPRDPRVLLNRIYASTLGQGQSADGEALVYIADALRSGVIPADLRAAFYKAAILIPGVTVTDRQATLDGRTGIAIGRTEPSSKTRQDIIIDPTTGLMIGERQVSYTTGTDIPPDTVVEWTAITTSVADSTPTAGTGNGQ